MKRRGAHRQTGWPGLHAVFLTALVGSHGLVGRRSTGLRAEGILGEFLNTGSRNWKLQWIAHIDEEEEKKKQYLSIFLTAVFGALQTTAMQPVFFTNILDLTAKLCSNVV